MELKDKKVLVLGLARSGKAAVRLLQHFGAKITINESKEASLIEDYENYVSQGIEVVSGGQPEELFDRDFDFVIKNPGINYHAPFILKLKQHDDEKVDDDLSGVLRFHTYCQCDELRTSTPTSPFPYRQDGLRTQFDRRSV